MLNNTTENYIKNSDLENEYLKTVVALNENYFYDKGIDDDIFSESDRRYKTIKVSFEDSSTSYQDKL